MIEGDPSNLGSAMSEQKRSEQKAVEIPVRLEKVLYAAAADERFREELLAGPEEAAKRRGLRLGASELAMLRAIPREQLRATIEGMDVSPSNLERRRFMRAVAVGAASIAAAEALAGCSDDDAPKPDAGKPDTGTPDAGNPDAGTPDTLPSDMITDFPAVTGIMPDMPGND